MLFRPHLWQAEHLRNQAVDLSKLRHDGCADCLAETTDFSVERILPRADERVTFFGKLGKLLV
jgi:hypothetical protein